SSLGFTGDAKIAFLTIGFQRGFQFGSPCRSGAISMSVAGRWRHDHAVLRRVPPDPVFFADAGAFRAGARFLAAVLAALRGVAAFLAGCVPGLPAAPPRSSILRCSMDMRSMTLPDLRRGAWVASSREWVRPEAILSSIVARRSSRYSSRYCSGSQG